MAGNPTNSGFSQSELSELNALLTAATAIIKRRRIPRPPKIHNDSYVGIAISVLGESRVPLHVREIAARISDRVGHAVSRDTIASRIARLAKCGHVFEQTGRGTYRLREGEMRGGG